MHINSTRIAITTTAVCIGTALSGAGSANASVFPIIHDTEHNVAALVAPVAPVVSTVLQDTKNNVQSALQSTNKVLNRTNQRAQRVVSPVQKLTSATAHEAVRQVKVARFVAGVAVTAVNVNTADVVQRTQGVANDVMATARKTVGHRLDAAQSAVKRIDQTLRHGIVRIDEPMLFPSW